MDNESNHGGARQGAGRKPKIEEIKLIEKLSPMDDIALDKLKMLLEQGDFNALKLFFEYRFGKAKQSIDLGSSDGSFSLKEALGFDSSK